MTQPGHLHLQEFFIQAEADFERAIDASDVAMDEVIDAKGRVLDLREQVRDAEAEMFINGGSGKYTVLAGTNEKKREATLRLALRDDANYQALRKTLGEAERELDRAEARRDTAGNRMALSRRRMDAYLSASNQRAAVLQVTREPIRAGGRNS